MRTIAQRVTDAIADQLGVDFEAVTPSASWGDDLRADSLDSVELAMRLEDEFAIDVIDDDWAECKTVADWIALVERNVAAQVGG
jgi:acyl carrier protein